MEVLQTSVFFGLTLTLLCYILCIFLKKKLKWSIINPLLFSTLMIIGVLLLADIDYDTYSSSTRVLSYLLTPVTVCLALPLYENRHLLKQHYPAIIAGITAGVISSGLMVWGLSLLFGLDHTEYVTMLPKSITVALGMPLCQELGGYPAITTVSIVITGMLGNMLAPLLCRLFRFRTPVSRGLAIGCASHAMGTARAMEMGKEEGAMSSLALSVSGIITVMIISVFASLL